MGGAALSVADRHLSAGIHARRALVCAGALLWAHDCGNGCDGYAGPHAQPGAPDAPALCRYAMAVHAWGTTPVLAPGLDPSGLLSGAESLWDHACHGCRHAACPARSDPTSGNAR